MSRALGPGSPAPDPTARERSVGQPPASGTGGAFSFRPGERQALDQRLRQHAGALSRLVVAIDGPGGSGKSTTARAVAERLGLLYVDTGAMYRALTLAALRGGLGLDDDASLYELATALVLRLEAAGGRVCVLLGEEDVTAAIRSPEVTLVVSKVSAHPRVREQMVRRQRQIGAAGGVVLDGRDIGTVVFPQAEVKVFVTADAPTRARRRQLEEATGGPARTQEVIEADLLRRDREDSTRSASPLVRAADAVLLDTSNMQVDEQVEAVLALAVRAVLARNAGGDPASGAAAPNAPATTPDTGTSPGSPSAATTLREVDPDRFVQPDYRSFHSPLYHLMHDTIRWTLGVWLGLRIVMHPGARLRGSVLVACNHIAGLDPPLVGAALPFEAWFVAKQELFRNRLFGRVIQRLNAIPIRRGTADYETLGRAVRLLRSGRNVVMFPEGTRQRPGKLGTARWGFGYVAARARRPILPVFVRGSRDLRPRGLRRQPLEIWIGEPVDVGEVRGADARATYVGLGALIMERITGLMLRSAAGAPLAGLDLSTISAGIAAVGSGEAGGITCGRPGSSNASPSI